MINRIKSLRWIGIAEGISFLVLLLIAMPLKYKLGWTLAVKYVGWAHGLLFILYVVAVFAAIRAMNWGFKGVVVALIASLLPAGTFVLDKSLRRREDELKVSLNQG
jgi:integral membrane protein